MDEKKQNVRKFVISMRVLFAYCVVCPDKSKQSTNRELVNSFIISE